MEGLYKKVERFTKDEDLSMKTKGLLCCFCEIMEELDKDEPELGKKFNDKINIALSGPHFTESTLEEALCCLVRRDGSKGRYWSLEQTNDVAYQGRIKFTEEFNQYDFCYAMNYCRAKYEESLRNIIGDDSVKAYFELAKSWIPDGRKVPEGGIWLVYNSLKKKE